MVKKVYEVVVVTSYLKDEMSGGVRSADSPIKHCIWQKNRFKTKTQSPKAVWVNLLLRITSITGLFFF